MRQQHLKKWRWLYALCLFLGAAIPLQAYDMSAGDISSSFDKSTGAFVITIPVYDDDGKDEGLRYSGNSKIRIKVGNGSYKTIVHLYSFPGYGDPQGDASWYWVKAWRSSEANDYIDQVTIAGNGSHSNNTEREVPDGRPWADENWTNVNSDKSGSKTYATLRFYLKEEALSQKCEFDIYLEVDKNNASDYNITATKTKTEAYEFKVPDVSDKTVPGSKEGHVQVKASGASSGVGSLQYTCNLGSPTANNLFNIKLDSIEQKGEMKAVYSFKRFKKADYTVSKKTDFIVPKYNNVNTFTATQDKNGATLLKWTVAGKEDGTMLDGGTGGFIIEKRIEGSDETKKFTFEKDSTFLDKETIHNPNQIVTYEIWRELPAKWGKYLSKKASINKTQEHSKVDSFATARLMEARQVELKWYWDYNPEGNDVVLEDKAKFVLTPKISVDGDIFTEEEEIIFDCKDYLSARQVTIGGKKLIECVDTVLIPQSCVLYNWTIRMNPGEDHDHGGMYKEQSPVAVENYLKARRDTLDAAGELIWDTIPGGLNDSEVASLEYFKSSKGYFGDRVELDWKVGKGSGSLDVFSVQRREYAGKDNTEDFVQIGTVEAISGVVNYSYTDTKAVPGKVYEYMIEGSKECANEEVKTHDYSYGFCTATGNIFGRITFESGQGVPNVEVSLETTADISGKSYRMTGEYYLEVNDSTFLKNKKENDGDKDFIVRSDSLAFQLFAKLDDAALAEKQTLLEKPGMYELYVRNDSLHFKVGSLELKSDSLISQLTKSFDFMQITAVSSPDSLQLYVNNVKVASCPQTEFLPEFGGHNYFAMGRGMKGYIDEVRVWSKSLTQEEIAKTYDRYLSGDEEGLWAYWNFNHSTGKEFYDFAHKETRYYGHDGRIRKNGENTVYIEDAEMSGLPEHTPSRNQLNYKDYTDEEGSYYISGVPYTGNSTLYTVRPVLGSHKFSPTQTPVTLSGTSVNHKTEFVDESSFPVKGTVTYEGSTIPVEGVQFYIDGVVCSDSKGNIITTDAQGEFSISVPVGLHEVKAVLANHTFKNGGRIVDDYGKDINYQDDRYSTVKLTDQTTVRMIGRVAGGVVQEAFKVGHSLSKNNLAEGVSIQLTYENSAYYLNKDNDNDQTKTHFLPGKWRDEGRQAYTNKVFFKGESNVMTIYPNTETGEFVADLLPIDYAVKVNVPGYDNVSGNNSKLSLSNAFIVQDELNQYTDSILVNNKYEKRDYSDTVRYNHKQLFIARVKPVVNVEQVSGKTSLGYFGDEKAPALVWSEEGTKTQEVELYKKDETTGDVAYTLGLPMFTQGNTYKFKASVYEEYHYYDESGNVMEDVMTDKVPSQDAVVSFQSTMSGSNDFVSVEADSTGVAYWNFKGAKVDLTSASANLNVKATVGNSDNATSISWVSPFNKDNLFITRGTVSKGNDFVTAGPDKLLAVLRDPPGSNSYSYLEKGTTFTETSSFTGTMTIDGEETLVTDVGYDLITFTGVGVGTINQLEQSSGTEVSLTHTTEWEDSETKSSTTTINTTFTTSDSEDYVGAMGDVFLGYSTNLSYGTADAITLVSADQTGVDKKYTDVYEVAGEGEYRLVKTTSFNTGTSFATLFAYPQAHIENRLLPEMETLRNSFLRQQNEMTEAGFQAEANATNQPIYVSLLPVSDPNYAKSNSDEVFKEHDDYYTNEGKSLFNGPSYKIYFPAEQVQRTDTIHALNQSMDAWIARLRDNERAKVEAIENGKLIQNFSMQAGATVEYSKGYSNVENTSETFSFVVGGGFATDVEFNAMGSGFKIEFNESVSRTEGNTTENEEEAAVNVGFVLADSGNDYLSVDVYDEGGGKNADVGTGDIDSKDLNLSTFIFRTRAGATSCPYEDEEVTKYYEKGTVISEKTLQVEVPEIAVENAFIENVPSGEPAYVTLYLRNNSAVNEDAWFNLIVDDQANQSGAGLKMDGGAIGNGRTILVPAGETLTKVLEVTKGPGLNYDNLQLVLASQCQGDPTANFPAIADTVTFTVHFTPSCSDVKIKTPANNWTYNTELPVVDVNGVKKHYMNVDITDFNVNYDNFKSIKLLYKPSSDSEENWVTLMNYFSDEKYYEEAIKQGLNAEMIQAEDKGTIRYKWFLDDMPDQPYDLCAVSVCNINNVDVENFSEIHSGVKDMYIPRLFGTPQPANGILTIKDDAKITFNEAIAAGYLTDNNFKVTGVKNGTETSHSVAVETDGNDKFESELKRSFRGKDITLEAWIQLPIDQDATFFRHGEGEDSLAFGITSDRKLKAVVNGNVYISDKVVSTEDEINNYLENWHHVALVLDQQEDGESAGRIVMYYDFKARMERSDIPAYTGASNYTLAEKLKGRIHNVRVWTEARTAGQIQSQSNVLLSGNEQNLLSYYPMDEAEGTMLKDKARGLNLGMSGGTWILPEGKSLQLNGVNTYLKLSSGSSVVIDKQTDYTIELWFKGDHTNKNATLLANGRADGNDWGGSENLFFLGFKDSKLTFCSNGQVPLEAKGNYLDDNWHHVAVSANRMTGRVQLYVDGELNTYADVTDYGQIASGYIYAGVTPVIVNATTNTYEHHFKGCLDDLRIWNLYKDEKSVNEGMRMKADSTAIGLLAYYPFEAHGVTEQNIPVVRFSLKDMKKQPATSSPVPDAIAVIGDVEVASVDNPEDRDMVEEVMMNSAIAPVKDNGGVTDLLFDFVVNNDALIVTLKEDPAKVEKTTVTFSVSGVRDLNGNRIASPITWTAYIDRNQLKWGEDEISLEKGVDEPLSFTMEVVNKGGNTEDYTISNYPSWIDVEPASGTLTATQSRKVTFTVDESVNIGTYNEVFYLTNSEGVSEPLNVTLKVNGKKPDWSVNPADYKFNMNVYGQLKLNGKFSNDTEDLLAAFENDVCVGVATNEYIKVNDMYYALLTVYSNSGSHENLEFKMWDASTGQTYVASPEKEIAFRANTIVGSPKSPVVFSNLDLVQLDVALENGWTWTSFNVSNDKMADISEILRNNEWASGDEVKREDGGVSTYGTETGWVGSLRSFDNEGMFMVRSSYAQTLSVIGKPVNTADNILTVRSVNDKGVAVWNYIPYLAQKNLTLNEALAGYEAEEGDVVKSQSGFAMYNGNLGWIGSLTYMQPGRGYMLQRIGTTTATLQYPSDNAQGGRANVKTRSMGNEPEMVDYGVANTNYARTMSMVATVEGIEVNEGDVLKAYANGEFRGESPVICRGESDEPLFFLSVAGEQAESFDVVVERKGEVVASAAGAGNFKADDVKGSYDNPIVISFVDRNSQAVYPSPFYNELFIRKQVDPKAKVIVTINDTKGTTVAIFRDCNRDGQVDIHWTDALNMAPGVYMVNINVNGNDDVYKVIKIKR